MERELTELRNRLDTIDHEIVALFVKRMQTVTEVAAYKRQHNIPILDAAREREMLRRLSDAAGGEMGPYTEQLFRAILEISRAYQADCSD